MIDRKKYLFQMFFEGYTGASETDVISGFGIGMFAGLIASRSKYG